MGQRTRRAIIMASMAFELARARVAYAQPFARSDDLASSLAGLAAERHLPLIFDRGLVRGLSAGIYRRDLPVDQALASLLKGTGLVAVRTASGAYVVRRAPERAPATLAAPPPPLQLIADILVVGRSTSNADLPRSEDDVQPYQILSAHRIDSSLAHTTDELLSEQLSMNLSSPGGLGSFRRQSFGSYIDLNGVGVEQTLVTIDGRRLPQIPGDLVFQPTDIGALAPGAIDRVETLGLTAGAIFGVGATGGALNVVLKHDYRGFELNVVNGVSQRGDDARRIVEAKAGFETPDDRTKGLVRVGYTRSGGDLVGARAVGTQQLALFQRLYGGSSETVSNGLIGDAITFRSLGGSPLQLSQVYGGGSLGQTTTWLPLNAPASGAGGIEILRANAGKSVTTLSSDGQGALASLVPESTSLSVTASLRQAVGDHIELFADALFLRDSQRAQTAALDTSTTLLFPGDGGNPFNNLVFVSYPTPGLVGHEIDSHTIDRETLGAIVRLGHGWSANADFSTGEARWSTKTYDAGNDANLPIDFLAGADSLASQLGQYAIQHDFTQFGHDRLYDANLRVAGPLFELPGGRATLTATGEWRRDSNPGLVTHQYALDGTQTAFTLQSQRQTVASGFVEARLPVLPSDAGFALTRGLKLQLVARHDRYAIVIPGLITGTAPDQEIDNHHAVTSFTLGGSVEPMPGLMLRASFADGFEPPTSEQLISDRLDFPLFVISDPKRGGATAPDSGDFVYEDGGKPDQGPQRARSLSVGVVIKPAVFPGLRLSFDYDRLLITHALTSFADDNIPYFLEHESEYPDRVVRAPLTAADAALGYTAGKIMLIDTGGLDVGRQTVKAFEGAIAYRRRLGHGTIEIFGNASWEPKYDMRTNPDLGATNITGLLNGPMKLRAVGGVDWSQGRWDFALNARYFGAYRTAYYEELAQADALLDAPGGIVDTASVHIPAKTYLDLAVTYSWPIRMASREIAIRYRLSVRNLMDVAPSPLATDQAPSLVADPYSDLIGRRFELSISAQF